SFFWLLRGPPGSTLFPYTTLFRSCELRAGAHLIRERWETFVGAETAAIFALPHLAGFAEAGVPLVAARRPVPGPAVIGSSTFAPRGLAPARSEEHTSELQSLAYLVCRLLLEKKNKIQ